MIGRHLSSIKLSYIESCLSYVLYVLYKCVYFLLGLLLKKKLESDFAEQVTNVVVQEKTSSTST